MKTGINYPVKAELGVRWIPQKSLRQTLFFRPATMKRLNITIGEGKGQNWWCVLFPPLCASSGRSLPTTKRLAKDKQQELYKEVLLDKKYDPLTEKREKPTTLKLKFKTLELIDELDKQKQEPKQEDPQ